MTELLIVRLAVSTERQSLEGLQVRAALSNAGDRVALLANPDAIVLPVEQILAGRVFVAEWDGVVAGFAAVQPRGDGDVELDGLFVEPGIRKQGIGRALVDYCVEYARAEGANGLHVVGNSHAADFYRACGFEISGTQETRFGVGFLMRKPL